ncbi:MAG TPA: hypothetical protein VI279_07380 [Rhodocyclaceae bacterium]
MTSNFWGNVAAHPAELNVLQRSDTSSPVVDIDVRRNRCGDEFKLFEMQKRPEVGVQGVGVLREWIVTVSNRER